MKKILLMCAAAMIAFAACEKTPDGGQTDGEVCEECGKNPCECTTGNELELYVDVNVQLQHEVNTNYEGTVASLPADDILEFFELENDEAFYTAMGKIENGGQVNNTLTYGICVKDGDEWVYTFNPSTSNNFGHWMTKEGAMTSWGSEEAPHYFFTEAKFWFGEADESGAAVPYADVLASVEDYYGTAYTPWDFTVGIEPGAYDLNIGDKLSATEFIFQEATGKTLYINWKVEVVDYIDPELGQYDGTPSNKEAAVEVTVGERADIKALQEAFQLTKFELNKAIVAGEVVTVNYINDVEVAASAGGFGGVWFDAEGNRTLWGSTGEDNPETEDVDESLNKPSVYFIELISSPTELFANSGYFSEEAETSMAGHAAITTFKQVVTYTPAEGESYTCTFKYTVKF